MQRLRKNTRDDKKDRGAKIKKASKTRNKC